MSSKQSQEWQTKYPELYDAVRDIKKVFDDKNLMAETMIELVLLRKLYLVCLVHVNGHNAPREKTILDKLTLLYRGEIKNTNWGLRYMAKREVARVAQELADLFEKHNIQKARLADLLELTGLELDHILQSVRNEYRATHLRKPVRSRREHGQSLARYKTRKVKEAMEVKTKLNTKLKRKIATLEKKKLQAEVKQEPPKEPLTDSFWGENRFWLPDE